MAAQAQIAPPRPKQFLGQVQRSWEGHGVVLAEMLHREARPLPQHVHSTAYFELILGGYYEEGTRTRRYHLSPFTLAFNPQGMEHDGAIHAAGTKFFTAELEPEWMEPFHGNSPMRETVAELHGGPMLWLAMRLYREYRLEQDACGETMDSLLWEMLAAAGRWRPEKKEPAWWGRAEEFLRENFREPVSLSAVAQAAGVHPVHLTRVCRQRQGRTIGEYLQGLRLQYACKLLAGEMPLSDIAVEAGFADQSHFTRLVQRYAGTTPAVLRAMLRSEKRKSVGNFVIG